MAKAKVPNLKTGRGVAAAFKKLIQKIEKAGHINVRGTRTGVYVDKPNSTAPWERDMLYRQFSDGRRLAGCCGVAEIYGLWNRYRDVPPGLSCEDSDVLFAAQLHALLKSERSRLAVATTIGSQKKEAATLARVGFVPVAEDSNPKTRAKITLWKYHRA